MYFGICEARSITSSSSAWCSKCTAVQSRRLLLCRRLRRARVLFHAVDPGSAGTNADDEVLALDGDRILGVLDQRDQDARHLSPRASETPES